ncbi:MAG: cell surface protein SprA [Bacteroidota bacterium]
MVRIAKYLIQFFTLAFLFFIVWGSSATFVTEKHHSYSTPPDTIPEDSINDDTIALPYPFDQGYSYPFNGGQDDNALYLHNPSNFSDSVIYDPETNTYIFENSVGDYDITPPNSMSFEDYLNYDLDKSLKEYWQERNDANSLDKSKSTIPKIHIGGALFEGVFGSNTIDIRPQGSAELIFGLNSIRRDDPSLDVKQRKTTNFDFQEKIQMNVTAKIGDKIELGTNYNTEATFEFENKMKLAYEGKEDEIIKLIEAGDVTLPLNSTLITGSQSLFGIKTKLQFGKTTVTGVFSQQKSKTSTIEVSGGAQTDDFDVKADQYEENKHFFIAQYFRNQYNYALHDLPTIYSNVNITKIEVWVTNIGAATTDNRNIVAFMDIGEFAPFNNTVIDPLSHVFPSNKSNDLYDQLLDDTSSIRNINSVNSYLSSSPFYFSSGQDYEKIELARKLLSTEYSYNSKLGFISLSSSLNADQTLAVAYQYTLIGSDSVYQVGEFSTDIAGPNALIVKLLKSTSLNTKIPLWNLMMKNIYSIGAYQVNSEDFRLNVVYTAADNGVPTGFFTQGNDSVKGVPIIKLLNLDNLNTQLDPNPDGVFDFLDYAATEGGTIQASNGRIFFPVLEPFGNDLRVLFNDESIANLYCYDSLYTMTKTGAQQYPDKNKFSIQGTYKSSSSSEISLNAMNVPQGSVQVTAGGITLTENVDYTVDYSLGRVKIINEGILNSGTPISITLESNSLFNIQTKTLMGAHIDHVVNKDLTIGATVLNLTERPITQKINFGDEPISNTIWGLNGTYEKESNFLTKMVDLLPFYSSKVPSKITLTGEFAHLIPGHARAIGPTGTSYIDDFEGSKSSIDMKNIGSWYLASTPQLQTSSNMFPEGALNTGLAFGFNRAKFCWYVIDPLFTRTSNITPDHITEEDQSNHYVRMVFESEVFPKKENPSGQPTNIAVLNVAYYPGERGQYNYDVNPTTYSSGCASDGKLNDPETRWGGIMRKIETTDFESTNMEYIEFWMMDPFIDPDGAGPLQPVQYGGDLYFNLGDISEDVLRDSRKSYENGLPISSTVENVDTTIWGRVPTIQALVNSFDNNPESRPYQDVGLDGLMDDDELPFFDSVYIQEIINTFGTSSGAYDSAVADASWDNFHYFRGTDYDDKKLSILERYKKYNGMDGNSPTTEQTDESYPTQATTIPNAEDINRDNTLSEAERYFQYKVQIDPNKMNVGENYITDMYTAPSVTLNNGNTAEVKWYQFKIPLHSPDKVMGNIQDFKSIRFMRMFMKDWTENAVLRFATLELVRGEWRKYNFPLLSPGEYIVDDNVNETTFEVSVVNIEENGERIPIPYVIPPGIEREINIGSTTLQQLNEQSLSLKVCNLQDGDARACYKTCEFDLRQFKKLKMCVHAEAGTEEEALNDGDLTVFIRLGTDFTSNYYEYEIPLITTDWYVTEDDTGLIWPASNAFDVDLSVFRETKMQRNIEMRTEGSGVSLTEPYIEYDSKENKVTVMGTPSLSDVRVIMIGVRNPRKTVNTPGDDELAKCAEVWVNELRLTDFIEDGGWAATTTANITLADLGTITLAGKVTTPGFGSIEKKVNERLKETTTSYDIATSIALDKFLPEKLGLSVPLYYDYSEIISNPQYNPLNPDIYFRDDLDSYDSKSQRDSLKKLAQDYTMRKSLNFVNVKKEKTGTSTKSHIYDVENLDLTYKYTEQYHRNVDIEYDLKKTFFGEVGYTFSNTPKNFIPLSKVKFLSKGVFKIVKDFNFYLRPKALTFRTNLDRAYSENMLRNKSHAILLIEPTYVKIFNWNRDYGLKWDITQNLKVDFTANTIARIDEPPGEIDNSNADLDWKRDSIMENISNMGRITQYDQALSVNYTLPINKIPFLNWVTASAKYSGGYAWDAAPLSTVELGNSIENSNTKQLNGSFNFTSLFNKVPYLKKLNQQKAAAKSTVKKDADTTETDTVQTAFLKSLTDNALKLIMGVKTVSFTYSQGNGTFMPGFLPSPVALGQDWNRNDGLPAPGLGFVFGDQSDIRQTANEHSWLSPDSMLNNAYTTKFTENFTARASVEPVNKFLIEITATRTFSRNHTEYFKFDPDSVNFIAFNPTESGAYSVSFFSWNTAFKVDNKTSHANETFEKFKENRIIIAWRLAQENDYGNDATVDSTGFPEGYGPTSQDVLIPAFLAAYTGKDAGTIGLKPFQEKFSLRDLPMPNWKITYDGLSKIAFIKKYLKTISLSHSYKSTYAVGAYTTNVLFRDESGDGFSEVRDQLSQNFIPSREIGQVTITEQFSPLFSIDMTWNNSLLSNFEIKKSRNLSLSFANNQLTDISSSEYIIGLGYRIKDVVINIKGSSRNRKLKSDLNIKADLSIKTNKTVLRKLIEDVNQISTGQRLITINFSADYLINDKFTVKFFFDKIITNPFVSSQFPNANTNAGFSLKFTLAQ